MKNPACVISGNGNISILVNGRPYTVAPNHVNYELIKSALKNERYDDLEALLDAKKYIENMSFGNIKIKNENILFRNKVMHNAMTKKIIELVKGQFPFQFMINFMNNVMQNPTKSAREELYEFLENGNIPITPDGCFLAYKKVDNNYRDFYTGKVDNHIGQKPRMPRKNVDHNRDHDCSRGYHFCSFTYLPIYHGGQGKVILVKINPKDVVSFPKDFNISKGRTCYYEVIADYKGGEKKEAFTGPVYNKKAKPVSAKSFCRRCGKSAGKCKCNYRHDLRDSNGKFKSKLISKIAKIMRDSYGRFVRTKSV